MRIFVLAALAAIALSACAGRQSSAMVEQGYQRGALGVAAIDRGDWTAAETQLGELRGLRSDDPARLLNLGRVYAETGRVDDAVTVWRLALASKRHFEVVTAEGRVATTDQLAREALARYQPVLRTAAR
ncbi:MAG: tetratricopeptide repeat protein [Allosphingosinicella sp.]